MSLCKTLAICFFYYQMPIRKTEPMSWAPGSAQRHLSSPHTICREQAHSTIWPAKGVCREPAPGPTAHVCLEQQLLLTKQRLGVMVTTICVVSLTPGSRHRGKMWCRGNPPLSRASSTAHGKGDSQAPRNALFAESKRQNLWQRPVGYRELWFLLTAKVFFINVVSYMVLLSNKHNHRQLIIITGSS
jgi:hypothetical protein